MTNNSKKRTIEDLNKILNNIPREKKVDEESVKIEQPRLKQNIFEKYGVSIRLLALALLIGLFAYVDNQMGLSGDSIPLVVLSFILAASAILFTMSKVWIKRIFITLGVIVVLVWFIGNYN